MNESLKWVTCEVGGPHILLPQELVALWHGCDPEADMHPIRAKLAGSWAPVDFPTYYDLACVVSDFVGLIPVAAGFGLVLNGDMSMSTWIPAQRFVGGYLIIPLAVPPDFDGYDAAVERLPESAFHSTKLSIKSHSGFLLFAAVDAYPDWDYPTLEVSCPGGEYAISTAEIETEELGILFLVHRLELNVPDQASRITSPVKRIIKVIGVLVLAAVLCVVAFIGGIEFLYWRSERQVTAIVSELIPGVPISAATARLGPPTRTTTDSEEIRVWLHQPEPTTIRSATLYFFVHRGPPYRYVLVVADTASQMIQHAEWQDM